MLHHTIHRHHHPVHHRSHHHVPPPANSKFFARILTVLAAALMGVGAVTGSFLSATTSSQSEMAVMQPENFPANPSGGTNSSGPSSTPKPAGGTNTSGPSATPKPASGTGHQCGANCHSNADGSKKFCYNECSNDPKKLGQSHPVYCSSAGYSQGTDAADSQCKGYGAPTPTGSKQIMCNASCKSNADGSPHSCYTECNPDNPGYEHDVWCGKDAANPGPWILKNERKSTNPSCGKSTGSGGNTGGGNTGGGTGGTGGSGGTYTQKGNTQSGTDGFHIEATVNAVNDKDPNTKCNVDIKFVPDGSPGCDGDIRLEQNGAMIAGLNAWNNQNGTHAFSYGPNYTKSPYAAGTSVSFTGVIARGPRSCTGQTSAISLTIPNCSKTGGSTNPTPTLTPRAGGSGNAPSPTPIASTNDCMRLVATIDKSASSTTCNGSIVMANGLGNKDTVALSINEGSTTVLDKNLAYSTQSGNNVGVVEPFTWNVGKTYEVKAQIVQTGSTCMGYVAKLTVPVTQCNDGGVSGGSNDTGPTDTTNACESQGFTCDTKAACEKANTTATSGLGCDTSKGLLCCVGANTSATSKYVCGKGVYANATCVYRDGNMAQAGYTWPNVPCPGASSSMPIVCFEPNASLLERAEPSACITTKDGQKVARDEGYYGDTSACYLCTGYLTVDDTTGKISAGTSKAGYLCDQALDCKTKKAVNIKASNGNCYACYGYQKGISWGKKLDNCPADQFLDLTNQEFNAKAIQSSQKGESFFTEFTNWVKGKLNVTFRLGSLSEPQVDR